MQGGRARGYTQHIARVRVTWCEMDARHITAYETLLSYGGEKDGREIGVVQAACHMGTPAR